MTTEKKQRMLAALAWMCEQYTGNGNGKLDYMFMGAGEDDIKLLI